MGFISPSVVIRHFKSEVLTLNVLNLLAVDDELLLFLLQLLQVAVRVGCAPVQVLELLCDLPVHVRLPRVSRHLQYTTCVSQRFEILDSFSATDHWPEEMRCVDQHCGPVRLKDNPCLREHHKNVQMR